MQTRRPTVQLLNSFAAHPVVGEVQDDEVTEPHDVTTTTRILRWFPCRRKSRRGDGLWDDQRKKWLIQPCCHKRCRRHWRRYALDKVAELESRRPDRLYWYHLVLHCRTRLKYKKRFPNLGRFVKKLRGRHSDAWVCAVFHEGRLHDHIDVLVGVEHQLDATLTRSDWQAHFPGRKEHQWRPQYCTVKEHDNPGYCLLYQFAVSKGKPRIKPPWGDIPYRSPYRLYVPG